MVSKKFWSGMIRDITPYTPGEQPKDRQFIKLNTNESPYPPSPMVLEAVKSGADESLRLYPDPESGLLCEAIAEFWGVAPGNVFPGNGSDEILAMAFMAFFEPGREIVFPDITYSFYPVYAKLFGIPFRTAALKGDFTVDVPAMRGAGGVALPNPNAPTGIALPLAEIERIVTANPEAVVLIDEAYVDFGAESAVGLTARYDNLLVVHTMSKSRSLAGMRIGYAIGSENLIAGLNSVKNSFNSYTMDRLAILAGAAAMRDRAYFEESRKKIIAAREKTADSLRENGFEVLPSSANFIYVRHPRMAGMKIFSALREKGILVRRFGGGRTEDFLRITVGTDSEMETLVREITEIAGGVTL